MLLKVKEIADTAENSPSPIHIQIPSSLGEINLKRFPVFYWTKVVEIRGLDESGHHKQVVNLFQPNPIRQIVLKLNGSR